MFLTTKCELFCTHTHTHTHKHTHICTHTLTHTHTHAYREAHPGIPLLLPFNVSEESECASVRFLEHVVATTTLHLAGYTTSFTYSKYIYLQSLIGNKENITRLTDHNDVRRGDVSISLISPYGTKSQLLSYRRNDFVNVDGFDAWPFMSVLHWGESPLGKWVFNVSYDPLKHHRGYAVLSNFSLTLYGAPTVPKSVSKIPESCHEECYDSCAGEGKSLCDRCTLLRHSQTLDCVSVCPPEFSIYNGYCLDPSNEKYMYTPTNQRLSRSTTEVEDGVISSMGTAPTRILSNRSHSYSVLSSAITVTVCCLIVSTMQIEVLVWKWSVFFNFPFHHLLV